MIENNIFFIDKEKTSIHEMAVLCIKKYEFDKRALDKVTHQIDEYSAKEKYKLEFVDKFGRKDYSEFENYDKSNIRSFSISTIKNKYNKSMHIEVTIDYIHNVKYKFPQYIRFKIPEIYETGKIKFNGNCSFDGKEFTRANYFISNIKWIEDVIVNSDLMELMYTSFRFSNNTTYMDVNFNELSKLRHFPINIELPEKENVDRFINALTLIRKNDIQEVRVGPIHIKNMKKYIIINFGGVDLVKEYSFIKYKYIVNPGLYMIIYYFQKNFLMDKLDLMTEKKLFMSI